jgi:hypothetical protein
MLKILIKLQLMFLKILIKLQSLFHHNRNRIPVYKPAK